jgi:AbrB family looped-hinge helix DNA binding protein
LIFNDTSTVSGAKRLSLDMAWWHDLPNFHFMPYKKQYGKFKDHAMKVTTRLSESGRISLPAEMRKALGIEPGGKIVVQLVDTKEAREIRIFTPNEGLRRAQEIARRLLPPRAPDGRYWSDVVIAERREEYERELRQEEKEEEERRRKAKGD